MEKILHANQATISTATIEIKVMKIGNKQVTLAVFRQLPSAMVISDETGLLEEGVLWGRVNYHVGCEGITYDHIHLVWQNGDTLYRDIAPPRQHYYKNSKWYILKDMVADYAESYLAARILEGRELPTIHKYTGFPSRLFIGGKDLAVSLGEGFNKARMVTTAEGYYFTHPDCAREVIKENGLPVDSDLIEKRLASLMEERDTIEQNWNASYNKLLQLDQLFIAV